MKTRVSPMSAWTGSLPRVLLLPACMWFLLLTLSPGDDWLSRLFYAGLASAIGMVIHFISYSCLGIPFYHLFWEEDTPLWNWSLAIPLGALLGLLATALLSLVDSGRIDSLSIWLGLVYGSLTAIGACWSRKAEGP